MRPYLSTFLLCLSSSVSLAQEVLPVPSQADIQATNRKATPDEINRMRQSIVDENKSLLLDKEEVAVAKQGEEVAERQLSLRFGHLGIPFLFPSSAMVFSPAKKPKLRSHKKIKHTGGQSFSGSLSFQKKESGQSINTL